MENTSLISDKIFSYRELCSEIKPIMYDTDGKVLIRRGILKFNDRLVAIKTIRDEEEGRKEYFFQKYHSKCKYSIPCYFAFRSKGGINIVMEMMDYTLYKHARENILGEEDIRIILKQILKAIQCIHHASHIHNDIKPENIFFKNGKVKIGDYGLSDFCETTIKGRIGTYPYMAPEVLQGKEYDQSAEIWSLGTIALFSAEPFNPLFEKNEKRHAYRMIIHGHPQFLNRNCYSKDFIKFVESCLKKEAKERPNVDELLRHPFITKKRVDTKYRISCRKKLYKKYM